MDALRIEATKLAVIRFIAVAAMQSPSNDACISTHPILLRHCQEWPCREHDGVDAAKEQVQKKEDEVAIVVVTDAIRHPWAVVVHLFCTNMQTIIIEEREC